MRCVRDLREVVIMWYEVVTLCGLDAFVPACVVCAYMRCVCLENGSRARCFSDDDDDDDDDNDGRCKKKET